MCAQGVEDGLQLLDMVADGTKVPAFAKLHTFGGLEMQLLVNYSLINYARLDNALDKGKGKGLRPG